MQKRTRCALAAACLLSLSSPLLALTFVVPPDRQLVRQATAIVIASPLASHTQLRHERIVETVTAMSIEEVLKGSIQGNTVDVHEPGGVYENRVSVIPGVPRFNDGERYILFLLKTDEGIWRVLDLVLGKFRFDTDPLGHEVAMRDSQEIAGWDPDGKPHREQNRAAHPFLDFIRTAVKGGPASEDYLIPAEPLIGPSSDLFLRRKPGLLPVALSTFKPTSYTFIYSGSNGARWTVFPSAVSFFSTGANAAALTALDNAIATWNNDAGSNVNLVNAGADNSGTHNGGVDVADGQNTVAFERNLATEYGAPPFTCSSFGNGQGSYGGTLGVGAVSSDSGTHLGPNGETFFSAAESDVEMNQGLSTCTFFLNLGDFSSAVAHELGHTLGLRHADQARNLFPGPAGSCSGDPALECSTSAIMKAFIPSALNGTLQAWDQHAVDAVYPVGACTAPSITTQPASTTITTGQSATLTVAASGDTPLSYQWYIGNPPSTISPTGNSSSLTVFPTSTTTYWVRVTNSCNSVNSTAATVTVSCTAPSITTQPASTTITVGQSATLTVAASAATPLSYQWYIGSPPSTSSPTGTNSSSLTVSPTSTTTYWVRVTNSCDSVDSAAATVTVSACPTTISTAPNACLGSSANTASVTQVTGATYAWSITNGTITGGAGTSTITFSPTAAGPVTLEVIVTSTGCSSTPSKTINAGTCGGSGDANGDGGVSAADIFYLINNLFTNGPAPAGGTGDANGDAKVTASDIFYLINNLFTGGPAPK